MNSLPPISDANGTQVQRIANAFALITLVLILCITLFPFDFTFIGYEARRKAFMSPSLNEVEGLIEDIQANILLFIPVGYALAVLVKRRERHMVRTLALVTAGGALLSTSVELLQLFIPFRYSSFIDIATNTMGTGVGFLLHAILGGRLSRLVVSALNHPQRSEAKQLLAVTYSVYLLFAILLSLALQMSLRSDDLENKIHVEALGDETSGKPWEGKISDMAVVAGALTPGEAQRVFDSAGVARAHLERFVAEFSYRVTFADSVTAGSLQVETRRGGNRPGSYRQVNTRGAVEIFSTTAATSAPFTIVASLTRDGSKAGRIATLGRGPGECEITFVQLGSDLAIRIRSMGTGVEGMKPQLLVPLLFSDERPHTFVLTYDRAGMSVYTDHIRNAYGIAFGPGFVFTHRLFFWKKSIELSSIASQLHTPFYYALLFAPFGYMLGIAVRSFRRGIPSIAVAAAAISPPILLERILSNDSGRAFDWDYVLLAGIMIAVGTALSRLISTVSTRSRVYPQGVRSSVAESET